MSGGTKPSNPKDIIGARKLPLGLVPAITSAYLALGHGEGMLKYGLVNWRSCGVRTSVYLDAMDRHVKKFKEGEWADPKTKVPHLANALACISIIVDAHHAGKLIDDRPLSNPGAVAFIDGEGEAIWHGLIELFGEAKPHHYTIGEGGSWRYPGEPRAGRSYGTPSRASRSGPRRTSRRSRTTKRSSSSRSAGASSRRAS